MTPEQAAQRIAELEAALRQINVGEGWAALIARRALRRSASHGTAILRMTVDGCEQVDLEDYLEPRLGEQGA